MFKSTPQGTQYFTSPEVALISKPNDGVQTTRVKTFLEQLDPTFVPYVHEPRSNLTDPEMIVKFAGQLDYLSFGQGHTHNADASKYFGRIKSESHGSILEHSNFGFLCWGISRSCTHEIVRHRSGFSYCLSGDTLIYSGSKHKGTFDGVKKSWTIKQLYEWSLDPKRKGRLKLITVRAFEGTIIVPAHIVNVVSSGVKSLYKMTLEDGKNITSTLEHRFLYNYKWTCLSELHIGDEVGVNGEAVWSDEARQLASERQMGENNSNWKGDEASESAARLRIYRSMPLIGLSCNRCGSQTRLCHHHKDEDIYNNDRSNIEVVCNSCHTRDHHTGLIMVPKWRKIVSVEYMGEEETYDLEIEYPYHNFVANGIITHNSQVSQRYVTRVRFVERPEYQDDHNMHKWFETRIDNTIKYYELILQDLHNLIPEIDDESKTEYRKRLRQCARSMLPNETETSILITANVRAWRHFLEMRANQHAEVEIRALAMELYYSLAAEAPLLFEDYQEVILPDGTRALHTETRKV